MSLEGPVAILSVVLIILAVLLFVERRLRRTIGFVDEQLQASERQLSDYREFTRYLSKQQRVAQLEKLGSLYNTLRFIQRYRLLLRKKYRNLLENYSKRTESLKAFLEQFVHEYVQREVERSKDFFGLKSFDLDQLEAIVKKDTYNLVLASAGSGKTRTLTARIAYAMTTGVDKHDILALAYTKSAAEEMRSRLKDDYNIVEVNVRTFHSLGRQLAQLSPKFRAGVAGNPEQQQIIKESCNRLCSDRVFAKLLLDFVSELQSDEQEADDFPSPQKYYEYLRYQRYKTLNDKQVKSIAERDIANFLFLNQVNFEYEEQAVWADRKPGYRTYRPDFFLRDHGIGIEHWAVDRKGNVPAWFSVGQSPASKADASTKYRQGMLWKRDQFRRHGLRFVETYNYQWTEGSLIQELRGQLEKSGVHLREMTREQILEKVWSLIPRRDVLNELMFSFISKAKTNGLTIADVDRRLRSGRWNRRQRYFAYLMIRVWREYESTLEKRNMIDFNDMINYALQVAKSSDSKLVPKYSQILIDEFQDITDPQLELIQSLMTKREESTLFCVGDDRQNIFSFAGSNIFNIIQFDKRFPYPEQTILSTNYRCPKNIVEASNFVANLNKFRVEKNIVPASKIVSPIRLMVSPGKDGQLYEEWQHEQAKSLLKSLIDQKKTDERILVLCRFNHPLSGLRLEFPQNEDQGLAFLSIHRAKGLEAEYVLVLSCISGRNGFPSEMVDNRVLDIVQNNRIFGDEKLEEERRLFYVALTRCKKQLYLFTSYGQTSRFVADLQPFLPSLTSS